MKLRRRILLVWVLQMHLFLYADPAVAPAVPDEVITTSPRSLSPFIDRFLLQIEARLQEGANPAPLLQELYAQRKGTLASESSGGLDDSRINYELDRIDGAIQNTRAQLYHHSWLGTCLWVYDKLSQSQ